MIMMNNFEAIPLYAMFVEKMEEIKINIRRKMSYSFEYNENSLEGNERLLYDF